MNLIDAITTPTTTLANAPTVAVDKSLAFADTLHAMQHAPETSETPARTDDDLRAAAAGLVAAGFIEPILASLRENNQAAGPFAPSGAEKRFGPLLDTEFATRITESAQFPLIDAITDRFSPKRTPVAERTTS